MKKNILCGIMLISISAFRLIDDLARYNINVPEFKEQLQSLATKSEFPNFSFYMPRNIRELAQKLQDNEKTAMAKAVGEFAKTYVSSASFKTEAIKMLDAQKESTDPESAGLKEEYQYKYNEQVAEIEGMMPFLNEDFFNTQQQMAEGLKAAISTLPDDTSADDMDNLKRTVAEAEAIVLLKPLFKSDKKAFVKKLADQRARSAVNEIIARRKQRNNEIDRQKDFKANIKKQLQQFLDETADVDFNAQTKTDYGRIVFVNPAYEQKSRTWKQAYRIGKAGTAVFRDIAREWLKEL
ncbi:MAG: hypothetical protein KF870_11635 [Leadbetterella sp.]|nr:hypothetical protein [Leadbetterella sp.]